MLAIFHDLPQIQLNFGNFDKTHWRHLIFEFEWLLQNAGKHYNMQDTCKTFPSPDALLLLVNTKNPDFWEGTIFEACVENHHFVFSANKIVKSDLTLRRVSEHGQNDGKFVHRGLELLLSEV